MNSPVPCSFDRSLKSCIHHFGLKQGTSFVGRVVLFNRFLRNGVFPAILQLTQEVNCLILSR